MKKILTLILASFVIANCSNSNNSVSTGNEVTFEVSGVEIVDGLKNMKFEGGAAPTSFVTQMVATLDQSIPDSAQKQDKQK